MNTMNVNGQNGVATSAIENAVDKAVNMINKAQYGKKGYVLIDEGLRLSFDGSRFFKGPKDNFIFNGKIEKKGGNGRYNQVLVEIHYKNLDNEEGFWQRIMVNAVLDAILVEIDNWIINYYKSESSSKWEAGLELYQNFRNDYFGSKLVVDNTDNLNSPDALNVNSQNGVATSANTSFSLISLAEFGYHKRMEFTELNKTELVRFIVHSICWNKSKAHFWLEFGNEIYRIDICKFDKKGYYVIVNDISYREVIKHCCDCFRLTEKNIDNIANYIYDLVADYFYGYHKADIAKADTDGELAEDLNSPDTLESPDTLNNDIESIMEFFGNDYKALNDIENEFFGYHFDIDNDLRDNLLFKRNGTFIDMYYKNMVIINNSEYIRLTDIKNIRDFENALFKLISTLINDNE
jgi:hypothetical protein